MKLLIHRNFKRSSKKLSRELRSKLREQLEIFSNNPLDKRLNNHALSGRYVNHRSIDLTGDWGVIFRKINDNTVLLVNIGTHSQLYG